MRPVYIACTAVLSLLWSCGKDQTQEKQVDTIVKYLDSKASVGWEYYEQGGVYVRIANAERDGYPEATIVDTGDSVYFYYAGYTNATATPALFATNIEEILSTDQILNRQYLSFDPYGIKLGVSPLIKGLTVGLPGVRQGDSLQIYMPSELAFGGSQMGTVPASTPVMYMLMIENVVKE